MELTLIYNPTAGFDKPNKEELIKLLTQNGYKVKFVDSNKDNLGDELEDPGDLVVVAGGDGTIAKVARRLIGKEVPLAIFSVGTANNIAVTFDACGAPEKQIVAWNLSKVRPFDVGIVSGSWGEGYFFESVGFGMLPALVEESKDKQNEEDLSFDTRQKKIDFSLEILSEIIDQLPVEHYQIELDGEDASGDYFLVEIMNIKSIGPHLFLAPDADPGDGLFDVVLMAEDDKNKLLEFVKKRLNGELVVLDVNRRRASDVIITTANTKVHVDDEIEEAEGTVTLRMNQQHLFVV